MLGKNSTEYKMYKSYECNYREIGDNNKIAVLGSTMAYYDYEVKLWNLRSINFASVPQTFSYDLKLLEKYSGCLADKCVVIINVAEFSFLVENYADDKRNHKYYFSLDPTDIIGYTRKKKNLLKYCPCIVDKSLIKDEFLGSITKKRKKNQVDFETKCKEMVNAWKQEFSLENDKLDEKYLIIQKQTYQIVNKIIDFCHNNSFIPVVVVPPLPISLKRLMPNHILDECLWNNIEKLKNNCLVLDYYYNSKIESDSLFQSPIILNHNGRLKFNSMLMEELKLRNMIKEDNLYYQIGKIRIPWISFGTGVIWKYTRNPVAFLKYNLKETISSIKHKRWNRELYGNLHMDAIFENAYRCGFRMFDR